ncbi:hypothetical protein B0H10DRAFT_2210024 [Mycena sp. CBHHK59/15]|nr:hypothetical protein B0H10DRAFT_2210024 [Mycena sp. CBHHK59/15]
MVRDMEEIKKKLQAKSTIPNEALVELFHACINTVNVSQQWLMTLLIGILKQAGQWMIQTVIVSLECCLLKILTLIFDERLRE